MAAHKVGDAKRWLRHSPDPVRAIAIKGELEALAPTGLQRNIRVLRRRGGAQARPTLEAASNVLQAAAMAMQVAEVAPTATQLAAATAARNQARPVMAQWAAVEAKAAALRP